jgi:uncharacterized protein YndB with AHSA1/START domain
VSDTQAPSSHRWRVLRVLIQVALVVVFLAALAIAGMWLAGSRMPEEAEVRIAMLIDAPAEELFDTAANPRDYPTWRPQVERIEILDENGGRWRWREHWDGGPPVELAIEEYTAGELLRMRIQDDTETYSGSWTITFSAQEGRTRVEIAERGRIPNPVIRFLARGLSAEAAEHYPRLWLKQLAERHGDASAELVRIETRVTE